MTESKLIDQHIAKLRFESVVVAGEQRRGCAVPGPHHPFFITVVDQWNVCHAPSDRELVRGLTQRQAFDRAMDLFNGGREAGLAMAEALPQQLAALTPDDLKRMPPAGRAYIEMLERLLSNAAS